MASQTCGRAGFSLLELLIALSVGFTLVAVIGEALLGEMGESGRLARMLRERAVSERALELMRMELQEALAVHVMPGAMNRPGCGLVGRTVLLHLDFTPDGLSSDRDVTYSLERKPDAIWRGQVLMRCGPSYGLDGQISKGAVSSSVWLDALDGNRTTFEYQSPDLILIKLIRAFNEPGGGLHNMQTESISIAPGLQI